MAQFDWASERSLEQSDLSGQGWMVGPYLSGRLAPDLYFTLRGAVGGSSNTAGVNVYADGTPWFSGEFQTRRALVRGSVYGVYELASGMILSPEIDLALVRERQRDYQVNDGTSLVNVPGTRTELGRLTLSALIENPIRNGSAFAFVRPALAWNFASSGTVRAETFRGSLELGLRTGAVSDWNASMSVRFDGLGSDSLSSHSLRLSMNRTF